MLEVSVQHRVLEDYLGTVSDELLERILRVARLGTVKRLLWLRDILLPKNQEEGRIKQCLTIGL
jgi:hypothetical protein